MYVFAGWRNQPERTSMEAVTVPLDRVRRGWDIVFETLRRRIDDGNLLHQVGFLTIRDSDVAAWR